MDTKKVEIDYIVIQAGGVGSRMKDYTKNKPKALVPINNLPILFHVFKKFPKKKFIIIADYKADVMKKYLSIFAEVDYLVVDTGGKKGTCSGINNALTYIPENKPFMLMWSDLILPDDFKLPTNCLEDNYIGISKGFRCRWKYENNIFEENPSENYGVAGLFTFTSKNVIKSVPLEGEFVAWLKNEDIYFRELALVKTKEYGLYETVEKKNGGMCRPFNKIEVVNNKIIKTGIDSQGKELAVKEVRWYRKAKELKIKNIPQIYQEEPLVMEKINGVNPYMGSWSEEEKKLIICNLVDALNEIHEKGLCSSDYFSINEAYYKKTIKRLEKIRTLVPYSNSQYIKINGKECRNIFYFIDEFEKKISSYRCNYFCFIHGDSTFSNTMIDEKLKPYFIDPRGYFGKTLLYGDPLYDWAKLYYSLVGNYDQFNIKRFSLDIHEGPEIELNIQSSGWEKLEQYFIEKSMQNLDDIKMIHAVIWLSLTTYAWEDYDSICGAFYNGLWYLEDIL